MMSGHERDTGPQLAELRVHQHYQGQAIQDLASRLRSTEDIQRSHGQTLSAVQEHRAELRRLVEGVRMVKVAGGLLMLALAATGQGNGFGEKLGRMLLGL